MELRGSLGGILGMHLVVLFTSLSITRTLELVMPVTGDASE